MPLDQVVTFQPGDSLKAAAVYVVADAHWDGSDGLEEFRVTLVEPAQGALASGSVQTLALLSPGAAYDAVPTVVFSGGDCTVLPNATAALHANGTVSGITLDFAGEDCLAAPEVGFESSTGAGAAASATLDSYSVRSALADGSHAHAPEHA